MLEVKVLGPGCSNCKRLYAEAEKAIQQLGLEASIAKVEKLDEIMTYRVMMTPALVINGKIKVAGRIPSQAELTGWLAAATVDE